MPIDEQTHKKLAEMIKIIEKRRDTFGKAFKGLAFSRNDKGELKACFGLVNFMGKGEVTPEETTYDYGNFILTKKSVKIQEAVSFIRSVFEKEVLKFGGWPEIPLKLRFLGMRFLQSRSRYGYISSAWPMQYAYVDIEQPTIGEIPSDSLSKLGLPLFPNGREAVDVFFELNLPKDWYTLEKRIEFLVPDYRARIKNLRLAGNKATVEVETKEIPEKDLLAKFYCKTESKVYTSGELPLEEGRASYVTDDEPIQVEVHILSAVDGESIDQRKFDYRYPSREEGIVIENIGVQLLDIIGKGENINVEFKRELDEPHTRIGFLKTIVAFANTKGGTIFLGVNDDCRITGFKEDAKTKIEDLIIDHCDPSIDAEIDIGVLVQGIPITLVKVPEGTNKPYILKNRGIFVRRGSSNRQMKRTELDGIYQKASPSSPYYH